MATVTILLNEVNEGPGTSFNNVNFVTKKFSHKIKHG